MTILSAMLAYLNTCQAVTDLVGTRIYPISFPEGALANVPFAVYQLVDEPESVTHDQQSTFQARVQFDFYGSTYKSAHAAADAFHSVLRGYRGHWGGFVIGGVFRRRKQDIPEPDLQVSRVSVDYIVNYREE